MESLEFRGTKIQITSLHGKFERVRYVRISQAKFSNLSNVLGIICSFPELEAIHLESMSWDWNKDSINSSIVSQKPLHFSVLDINGYVIGRLLKWLLALDHTPTLQYIYAYAYVECREALIIRRFFDTVGPSVQSLKMGLSMMYDITCDWGKYPVVLKSKIGIEKIFFQLFSKNASNPASPSKLYTFTTSKFHLMAPTRREFANGFQTC